MADDLKNRVLEATDLYSLVSEHVRLMASGSHHRGLCPFHQEKTPSFYLFPNRYHCFGCSASGDAITFVMKTQGLSFPEALAHLASRAGIDASRFSTKRYRQEQQQLSIKKNALASAQNWFFQRLWHSSSSEAAEAQNYLLSRHYSKEFLQKHGFGLSSHHSHELLDDFKKQGYNHENLLTASLIAKSQRSSTSEYYDFFLRRITFPIHDHSGKLIAFAGRLYIAHNSQATSQVAGKYKNSKYPKNKVLYGFWQAKQAFLQKKRAIITEGYLDVLRLWQYGFQETVASQGTALTVDHLKALSRLVNKAVLLFDGDQAGKDAAMRSLAHSIHIPDLSLYCALLPSNHDPDSFLLKHKKEDLEDLILNAKPLLEVVIEKQLSGLDSIAMAGVIDKRFFPWMQSIPPLQQASILRLIAQKTGLSDEVLHTELDKSKSSTQPATLSVDSQTIDSQLYTTHVLPSHVRELLSHLFFLQPHEAPSLPKDLSVFISCELEIDALWQNCLLSLLPQKRTRIGYYPFHNQDLTEIFHSPAAANLLEELQSAPMRYDIAHDIAISRIMNDYRLKHITSTIETLTQQLSLAKDDPSFPRKMVVEEIVRLHQVRRNKHKPQTNP